MIAIISDVHSNLAALEAVLRDIDRQKCHEVYCLGDIVGYNSFPHETLALMRSAGIISIKGNHDLMAIGAAAIAHCGSNARAALVWTSAQLTDEEREYLAALPTELLVDPDILLVHSRVGDPFSYLGHTDDYIAEREKIRAAYPHVRVCFTGHTHVPGSVEVGTMGIRRRFFPTSANPAPDRFHFLNPGSVGHPRHSDYRATYALYDPATHNVQWRRVSYDKKRTRRENLHHDLHTELGPGLIRFSFRRMGERLRSIARGGS